MAKYRYLTFGVAFVLCPSDSNFGRVVLADYMIVLNTNKMLRVAGKYQGCHLESDYFAGE